MVDGEERLAGVKEEGTANSPVLDLSKVGAVLSKC